LTSAEANTAEMVLRDELDRADRAVKGVAPVLSHLLAHTGHSLISDAVIARIRGMLNDITRQLVAHLSEQSDALQARLNEELGADDLILRHFHANALEALLAERLEQSASLDPVLSPLLQELIASPHSQISELAMQVLTAQSRFMQMQRRMHLSVQELPADVFARVLMIFERVADQTQSEQVSDAVSEVKSEYDEAIGRIALFKKLASSMNDSAIAALELEHSGLALFVTVLAQKSSQSREQAVLACQDQQSARLALGLKAAGLQPDAIERQFALLDGQPLGNLDDLSSDAARELLGNSELASSGSEGR